MCGFLLYICQNWLLLFISFFCGFTMILKLELHVAICLIDFLAIALGHYVNLKVLKYESASFNRIVADKSHRLALALVTRVTLSFQTRIMQVSISSITILPRSPPAICTKNLHPSFCLGGGDLLG